jgi:predicted DNA-binding transcriptional regulator YafY
MGRRQKVYASQVEDILKVNSHPVTVDELAYMLEVTSQTIRNKLKELRGDGRKIVPTNHGVILKEKITNEEDAQLIRCSAEWVMAIMSSLAGIAEFTGQLLIQSAKFLATKEERKAVRQISMQLRQAADLKDIDEEMSIPGA